MKKFNFSLETVLGYKEQVLDSKQNEHGKALAAIRAQEEVIERLEGELMECRSKFREKSSAGVSPVEAMSFEAYISFLRERIKMEEQQLFRLKAIEEQRRSEVVEAKVEASTIEKLKQKKRQEYDRLVQKNEELFIEDFVSNKMSSM